MMKPKVAIPAGQVYAGLEKLFKAPAWCMVSELSIPDRSGVRRMDAFAIRVHGKGKGRYMCHPETGLHQPYLTTWAIEVKVDRADFLEELRHPEKRMPAMSLVNYFAFATPAGLVQLPEIPETCGLIEVDGNLESNVTQFPDHLPGDRPGWRLFAAFARAMMK